MNHQDIQEIFDDELMLNDIAAPAVEKISRQLGEAEEAFEATLNPDQRKLFKRISDLTCQEAGALQMAILRHCRKIIEGSKAAVQPSA